jgi:hypothetical protein
MLHLLLWIYLESSNFHLFPAVENVLKFILNKVLHRQETPTNAQILKIHLHM